MLFASLPDRKAAYNLIIKNDNFADTILRRQPVVEGSLKFVHGVHPVEPGIDLSVVLGDVKPHGLEPGRCLFGGGLEGGIRKGHRRSRSV